MFFFFFFNDTATTEIYTLSLHDALPILNQSKFKNTISSQKNHVMIIEFHTAYGKVPDKLIADIRKKVIGRSEEHTSELQSQSNLVCRLLLEKKKKKRK